MHVRDVGQRAPPHSVLLHYTGEHSTYNQVVHSEKGLRFESDTISIWWINWILPL